MKARFIVCFIVLLVCSLFQKQVAAQNLVPNPSFDSYKKKPCSPRINPPDNIGNYLNDWYSPTRSTPDIYSTDSSAQYHPLGNYRCYNNIYYNNLIAPHSGIFYVGSFTLYNGPQVGIDNAVNVREYIQTRLKEKLVTGKVYKAEMHVMTTTREAYYSNNIGILFSLTPVTSTTNSPILATPQVNRTTVFDSTETWVRITQEFVAAGPYEYLTIGNFFDDKNTLLRRNPNPKPEFPNGAYYYYDDISVTDAGVNYLVTIPNVGRDTTLCRGQSVTLRVDNLPQTRYRWDNGSNALTRTVDKAGLYYVTATTGNYSVTDSIRVTIPPPVALPADTVFCRGETLTLAPTHPLNTFIWSDTSRDSTLTVRESGQYWVEVPSPYCLLRDTIRVQVLDCPGEAPNVFTPNGDGRNDRFVVPHIELSPWGLVVYNRWGGRVYEAARYGNDWDGGGLPAGVYYYELSSAVLNRRLKGWVTLIR
ncbi:MAG: gliding motility-associated C-terminal domain-containing protein [Cytophagales bacterium]|nr:MAG: gliding motility-associated C-terminal domain-containing protein [Cytophagales bacterium]